MIAAARRLVVATGNPHKLAEIRSILREADASVGRESTYELVSMRAFEVEEPVEDGETFEDNALVKARACALATGLPAVADDSGLEVDALGGQPGVRSARYAGEPSDDARNNAKLVAALSDVAPDDRTARFVCAAAVVSPDARERVVRGTLEGHIIEPGRGGNGFGYDPYFVPAGSDGRTTAELSPAEKDAVSHRGAAFRRLVPHLEELLP